jgi:hypothetical protein
MPHRGPRRRHRLGNWHGHKDVSGCSCPPVLDWRRSGVTPSCSRATKATAMAGCSGGETARGPPAVHGALGRCGASAQRSQFASAAMTVMFTDATSSQLARQPAQHGNSRPRATADDHEAHRQARFTPLASDHSVTHRGPHRRRRFTGATPDL